MGGMWNISNMELVKQGTCRIELRLTNGVN